MKTWTNTPIPVETRFWSRVEKGDGCWNWTSSKTERGYGKFKVKKGKMVSAHRFSYELNKGPIPDGMVVMHSCDNPSCVNPAHLSAGTQGDNIRDCISKGRSVSANAKKTHCIHGHELTPENTFWRKGGGRKCRKCIRILRVRFKRPVTFSPLIQHIKP